MAKENFKNRLTQLNNQVQSKSQRIDLIDENEKMEKEKQRVINEQNIAIQNKLDIEASKKIFGDIGVTSAFQELISSEFLTASKSPVYQEKNVSRGFLKAPKKQRVLVGYKNNEHITYAKNNISLVLYNFESEYDSDTGWSEHTFEKISIDFLKGLNKFQIHFDASWFGKLSYESGNSAEKLFLEPTTVKEEYLLDKIAELAVAIKHNKELKDKFGSLLHHPNICNSDEQKIEKSKIIGRFIRFP